MGMAEEKKDPRTLLTDAIKRRDELNTFIKVLQEMIGGGESLQINVSDSVSVSDSAHVRGEIADPLSAVYPGMFFGKSQPQAVELLLEKVGRPLKTRTIFKCLEHGGMKVGGKKPLVNL